MNKDIISIACPFCEKPYSHILEFPLFGKIEKEKVCDHCLCATLENNIIRFPFNISLENENPLEVYPIWIDYNLSLNKATIHLYDLSSHSSFKEKLIETISSPADAKNLLRRVLSLKLFI
jgi:hypothetical protein